MGNALAKKVPRMCEEAAEAEAFKANTEIGTDWLHPKIPLDLTNSLLVFLKKLRWQNLAEQSKHYAFVHGSQQSQRTNSTATSTDKMVGMAKSTRSGNLEKLANHNAGDLFTKCGTR